MEQYIPKSALVAEIKKLRDTAFELYGISQFNSAYNNVLKSIDTLEVKEVQEEPESEGLEEALAREWKGYNDRGAATVDALEDNTQELAFAKGFYRGAQWGKNQAEVEIQAQSMALAHGCPKEPVSEELEEELSAYVNSEEYINSIGTSDLFLIARHFANWQKEQMMKDAVDACVTDIRTYKEENEVDFSVMYEKGIIPYEIEQEVKVIVIKED